MAKATKKTTKTTAKKAPRKTEAAKEVAEVKTKPVRTTRKSGWSEFVSKNKLPLALGLGAVLVLLYLFKGYLVSALVNGQPITRLQYVQEMENRVGQETLDNLVTQILIKQEADKQGITVDETTIDAEMQRLEEQFSQQGQSLDSLLEQQGMSRQDLRDQLKIQQQVQLLVGSETEPSEEQIAEYLEQNEAFLPEEATDEEKREMAIEQLSQQSQSEAIQNLIERLRTEASIIYW